MIQHQTALIVCYQESMPVTAKGAKKLKAVLF